MEAVKEVRKILLDLNHIEYSEAQTIDISLQLTKKGLKSSTLLIRVE